MNRNNHIKIALLITLINAAAFYGWFWLYGETDVARSEIYVTRTGLAEIDARVTNIKRLEKLLEEAGDKRAQIGNSFIDSRSLVLFIEKMEEIATTTSTALKVESASVPINEKGLGPNFRLELRGDFSSIYRFIDMLMATNYQVLLDKMYLEKNLEVAPKYVWKANLEIRVLNFIF